MAFSKLKKIEKFVVGHYWKQRGFASNRLFALQKSMKEEYKKSPLPVSKKKWAVKRGFFPYRIHQYGLTEENYRSFISDWDYEYLFPQNNQYRIWVVDKLTTRYILTPFKQYLPKYYYHLMQGRDVMRLMDCPEDYPASLEGIIRLLRCVGTMAAKKSNESHGIGFYKLAAKEKGFEVNGEHYSENQFKVFLKGLDDVILTEYVKMHPDIEKLNSESVNTIRLTVINEHGNDPIIPFAFLRIGTKKSGVTDNLGSGGMVCKINMETGQFYDGEMIQNHVFVKTPVHPDTKEKMEGVIPNWELVKSGVIQVCNYIPELEWLGFDISITPGSFCIIEINTSQNLHKAYEYPEEIKGYLSRKLKRKKDAYGLKN